MEIPQELTEKMLKMGHKLEVTNIHVGDLGYQLEMQDNAGMITATAIRTVEKYNFVFRGILQINPNLMIAIFKQKKD